MNQGLRLITKPRTFFNQLQWSPNHWLILLAFLTLASIETQTGSHVGLYQKYATLITAHFNVTLNTAVWIIAVAKLVVMIWGAFSLASILFLVGNLFGRQTSRRVFFRRSAVVFTVLLAAYTASHNVEALPVLAVVSVALYAWSMVLGYFALREQFELTHVETVVLGSFALLLVVTSFHFTDHVLEAAANVAMAETSAPAVATAPATRPAAPVAAPKAR